MGSMAVIIGCHGGCIHDNAIMSGIIIVTRCGDTIPGTLAIKGQHCYGNEKDTLKQQSTVNTEAPKTVLKYYSEFYLLNNLQNYFSYPFM